YLASHPGQGRKLKRMYDMRLRPRLSAWTTVAGVFLAVGCLEAARDQSVRKPLGRPEMAVFYVSPNGKDNWSGRWPDPRQNDGPFATVARARDAVRALLKSQKGPQPVRVVLRPGTYTLNQTLEFGPEGSGTKEAPVVYTAT